MGETGGISVTVIWSECLANLAGFARLSCGVVHLKNVM